ncbi:MAG: DUF898 family protein [Deinococcales bacterium]
MIESDSPFENSDLGGKGPYVLEFRGSSPEFFRIWIINWLLTILTLGIYFAWAKVRTRRYFYANTFLDHHPFEYHAKPIPILKGHILIAILAAIYYGIVWFMPSLSILVVLIGMIFAPYVIYKSLRFKANYSSYRHIPFKFTGTLGQSYHVNFWIYFLVPISLGFISALSTEDPILKVGDG